MNNTIQPEKILAAVEGLKGLSHETRLTILCSLIDGEKTVTELTKITNSLQTSVSQHLAKMQHAGWVKFRREGAKKHYSLANPGTLKLLEALHEIFCTE